jgi:hypothetical protein
MAKTEYDPADTDCVISASNYLEISEFALFMEAYADWFGKVPSEKQMEKVFSHYLLENRVPFWVRNYANNRVPEEYFFADITREDSQTANSMLYLISIIAEYVLLACYLLAR